MSPQRIQRKRVKGWKKPEGAVYVGRGSRFGNVYRLRNAPIGADAQQWVVDAYREWLTIPGHRIAFAARTELAGKDLMCWCPLEDANGNRVPCHADVLLEIANAQVTS